MANWNLPTVTSGYLDFVTEMNEKFVDAGTVGYGSPTNLPEHAIRFNRSVNIFEEWIANAWVSKVIGVSGGGTGASTASESRVNLGLGSMSTQNSNAVNITGGSITGVTFSGSDITTGILALARGGTGASLVAAPFGYPLISDGTKAVFGEGLSIPTLNANALVTGTVPDARLSANIPRLNVVNQFTRAQRISNQGGDIPRLTFIDLTQPVDRKIWEINLIGGNMNIWGLNDIENTITSSVSFQRDGTFVSPAGFGNSPLNANYITSGTIYPTRLAPGPVGDTRYFLRNDQTWAIPPGSGGEVSPIPSGMIGMFSTACPSGWTRVADFDNRFPLGSTSWGQQGGASTHSHSYGGGGQTGAAGGHAHAFSGGGSSVTAEANVTTPVAVNRSGPDLMLFLPHAHNFGFGFSGDTNGVGDHTHSLPGGGQTGDSSHIPPYTTVVFCMKN